MSHFANEIATLISTDSQDAAATVVQAAPASTKDSGRVKVGGVAIRFKSPSASVKDAGRVRVGGVAIRF